MRASASGLLRRVALRALDQRASVYTLAAGYHGTPVKTGLACSLQTVSRRDPSATTPQRSEPGDIRTLYYDPAYTMPEGAVQIEVDSESGIRWNVRGGAQPNVGAGGVNVLSQVDLVRAR